MMGEAVVVVMEFSCEMATLRILPGEMCAARYGRLCSQPERG
jgi:hypothetical protein